MAYTFFPSATTSGGGPFHFFQYEVTVGIISVDGFESRFALACQPKGTCKEEIHRLFTAKHINPRTFSDCTDLDSTMYYRLQNEAEQPKLSTIVSLCVGFSLDTLTGYHLIALAGYTLLPRNTLHRIYAYFIENSQSLTISECNKFLEDMGFYIVDNMPAAMILKFAEFCAGGNGRYDRVALVYDVRTASSFTELFDVLDKLKDMEAQCRMLFLEAAPEVIIKRYKETRRRHPLAADTDSLEEAVKKERAMMAPVKERADFVIDTSRTSTAQLRGELLRLFGQEGEKGGMTVSVTSFGFKYGLPLEADLVFDVRFMPNPFYMEDLRPRTGLDQAVADYVFHFPQTQDYMRRLEDLLAFSLPLYAEEGKTSLTIAVGCTGGHHRSVAVTHALAGFIHGLGYQVLENHRDMTRGG